MSKLTYTEAVEYIHKTPKFSRILGNDVLKILLERLGNPQKKLKFIHLAGTNGKGSTASMIANILKCEGYKTGLYTSPFLEVFNERIRIDGENIPDDVLAELVSEVKSHIDDMVQGPSEFALTTAVMFLYFARENCDYVVLETGMGGKLDATNVIDESFVTVITSISLDHTQFLGDSIEKITLEKCGIIKKNASVVCYCSQDEKAVEVIKSVCGENNAELIISPVPKITGNGFLYGDKEYKLKMCGSYQPYNATMALAVIDVMRQKGVSVGDDSVKAGIESAEWAGRFEYLNENLVIDGGHNPNGIAELKKSLAETKRPVILVMAMMEDKSYAECIAEIAPIAKKIYAAQIDYPRCLNAKTLADIAKKYCVDTQYFENAKDAVKTAVCDATDNDLVCVCGSLYFVGLIRNYFNKGEI